MDSKPVVITANLSRLLLLGIPHNTLVSYVTNTSAIVVRNERLEAPVGVKTGKNSRPGALRGSILQKTTDFINIGYTVGPTDDIRYARAIALGTGIYAGGADTGAYHPSRTAMNRDGRIPDKGGIKPDQYHVRAAKISNDPVVKKINDQIWGYSKQTLRKTVSDLTQLF